MINLPRDNKLRQTLHNHSANDTHRARDSLHKLDYILHPAGVLFYEGQQKKVYFLALGSGNGPECQVLLPFKVPVCKRRHAELLLLHDNNCV